MAIHPTAIVSPAAEIHASVEVGPYAVIGPQVKIDEGVRVGPHAVIEGQTTIGKRAVIFHHASVGAVPQDLKYGGESTRLEIGEETVIREFASVHIGTDDGGGVTRVGKGCLLMAYSHIAHDVQLGDRVIVASGAMLAGHVEVGDHVIFGGLSGVHQFVRIGAHAFIAAHSMIGMDVPPYCVVSGHRAQLAGLNTVGLMRRGIPEAEIRNIKKAYRILFRMKLGLREAMSRVRAEIPDDPRVEHLLQFVEGSQRGVTRR